MTKTNIVIASLAVVIAGMGAYIYTMNSSTPMIDMETDAEAPMEQNEEVNFEIQANSNIHCTCDDSKDAVDHDADKGFTCASSIITQCVHSFCSGKGGTCKVGSKSIKIAPDSGISDYGTREMDSTAPRTLSR